MTNSERPKRRPRYKGKNPRHFSEKYKELAPDLYPGDAAKVIARGQTPAGTHRPIMVCEILEVLAPQPGELVVDCTLGYGGHAAELLAAIQPGGRLIGIDVDAIELKKTAARLRAGIVDRAQDELRGARETSSRTGGHCLCRSRAFIDADG